MKSDLIHIGVVTVRGLGYPPTRRLAEAAADRGCRIVAIHPYQIYPSLLAGAAILLSETESVRLQAVLPRQGAEIRDACLPLISHFERAGIPVINQRRAIETVRHKYTALQHLAAAGLPVVDTIFATDRAGLALARRHFEPEPAVIKPVSSRQGRGIFLARPGEQLPDDLAGDLDSGRGLLCQRFVPSQGRSDLRVMVIGGKVAGAMSLSPPAGEFRANFHLGATAETVDPDPSISALALSAVRAVGLQIAGVDLMIDQKKRAFVNEVNYSPGFQGFEKATGVDAAGAIIDYVLSVIKETMNHPE